MSTAEPSPLPTGSSQGLPPGIWYSTAELARILGVDPSTLRRWRTAHPRQGPPYVPLAGRVVLCSATDVEQWIAQRRISPERGA
ncbi:helix-turn-helix domain-containing protein [Streptomyces sp. NPDC047315]|uniref:helix-turn-helix transcriptional regulator n=1 Tax=Streptomyces sp. NPDC047315 TaxID=3155142 RepID=UPI0033C90360